MYRWLNELSQQFLEKDYLLKGQTVDQRVDIICNKAEEILGFKGYAAKLKDYFSRGWYSFSTPIWTNFGNKRGLPISCYGSQIEDSMESIVDTWGEVSIMTKVGGGTSAYFGKIRPRGSDITDNGKSSGSVHFMKAFDTLVNITSQGCYDSETELLTNNGWVFFKDLPKNKNVLVAQVNDDESVSFVQPNTYFEYDVDEELFWFKDSKNIDLLVTKNHNMVFKREQKTIKDGKYYRFVKDKFCTKTADKCPLHRDIKFLHSAFLKNGDSLSVMERLMIAFQADGGRVKTCKTAVKFRFSKNRKSERLKYLLNLANIKYTYSFYETDKTHNYYINFNQILPKKFEWVDLTNKSYEWCRGFLSEVSEWDSSKTNNGSFSYTSEFKINVDKIQEIASLCGYKSYSELDLRENEPNKNPIYKIYLSDGNYFGVEKLKIEKIHYVGKVYCVEVPSNKLIIRRGGRTVVCGNSSRRGNFAAYLPIDHGDIDEFLSIKSEGHPIQDLSFGVCVPDKWLNEMISGDSDKRKVWAKVIESRTKVGYPYIFFTDNVNNNKPECYKNLEITHSNLCCEIMEPDSEDESFVCDLASMNMLYWDEWKNTDAIEVLVQLLDAVMSEFIDKAQYIKHLERAVKFAIRHRAIGIGWFGWHSLLQSKMIPFESMEAKYLNVEIAKNMKEKGYEASKKLGHRLGVPEVCKGTGRRNAVIFAIAPTTSSSWIIGQTSQSIEPFSSNYYIKDLAKGKFSIKNPYLISLLDEKGKNTNENWLSILEKGGSVQHLDFLSEHEKAVFKTFAEIPPKEIIIQAAQRQKYIDQGQSLNLMIHPSTPTKEVNALILEAWKLGVKSLYYQFSVNSAQEFSRSILECKSCEA